MMLGKFPHELGDAPPASRAFVIEAFERYQQRMAEQQRPSSPGLGGLR